MCLLAGQIDDEVGGWFVEGMGLVTHRIWSFHRVCRRGIVCAFGCAGAAG